jgi:hypothetical protein
VGGHATNGGNELVELTRAGRITGVVAWVLH